MKINYRKIIALSIPARFRRLIPKYVSKHLYFSGEFTAKLTGTDGLNLKTYGHIIENEIFYYGLEGGHEKKSMQIWIEFCEKFQPKNIFDIGASTGIFGLVAQRILPDANVSYFEPMARALEILKENIAINSFPGKVFPIALSNYDGVGHFYMSAESNFAYSVTLNDYADLAITGEHTNDDSLQIIVTQVNKVSTLISRGELAPPNLVKIDVETHEAAALEGFEMNLSEINAFLIEVLNEKAATKLNRIFANTDFLCFNINDSANSVRQTEFFEKSDEFNYFVVHPSFASDLISLK